MAASTQFGPPADRSLSTQLLVPFYNPKISNFNPACRRTDTRDSRRANALSHSDFQRARSSIDARHCAESNNAHGSPPRSPACALCARSFSHALFRNRPTRGSSSSSFARESSVRAAHSTRDIALNPTMRTDSLRDRSVTPSAPLLPFASRPSRASPRPFCAPRCGPRYVS